MLMWDDIVWANFSVASISWSVRRPVPEKSRPVAFGSLCWAGTLRVTGPGRAGISILAWR